METQNKRLNLMKYSPVVCFLALEVFALVAFSLGNSPILFGLLMALLAIILVIFSLSEMKKEGLFRSLVLLIPIVVYVLLTCISPYTTAHIGTGDFPVAEVAFVALGLTSVAIVGYTLSLHKEFNISTFLTVVFSAIAILVFINLIINLVNFGPCYSLIYKDYYMYYGGKRSNVRVCDLAYVLEGFKFIEVKMSHYTLYPILLLTSSIVLINLSYKENKIKFFLYLAFSVLGVLALVFVPSLIGLIYAVILLLILSLMILFKKTRISKKPFAIILYLILGIAGFVLLVMLLNNQGFANGFSDLIRNNAFLDKIFNTNQYARLYNPNLTDVLCTERFFGFYSHQIAYFYSDLAHLTDSILFDNFMTSGVLGVAIIAFLFIKGFMSFNKYEAKDQKSYREKSGMLLFVLMFLIYSMMNADGEYGIFHNIIRPTYTTSMFMIVLFIIVYVYCLTLKKKEVDTNEI